MLGRHTRNQHNVLLVRCEMTRAYRSAHIVCKNTHWFPTTLLKRSRCVCVCVYPGPGDGDAHLPIIFGWIPKITSTRLWLYMPMMSLYDLAIIAFVTRSHKRTHTQKKNPLTRNDMYPLIFGVNAHRNLFLVLYLLWVWKWAAPAFGEPIVRPHMRYCQVTH